MARSIEDIRETYARLLDEEEKVRMRLERARTDLPTVREADEEAFADAALADRAFPKRKEVTLRHAVENEEVALGGYNLAHRKLLEEACDVVGEGRRPLDRREQVLLRRRVELDEFLTDDERQREWEGSRKKAPPRPDDLVEFVEAAYGWLERGYDAAREEMRKKDGYDLAIAHIQQAKAEHKRQGHMPGTFSMHRYPRIVTAEDLTFLDSQEPAGGQYWPGSMQDPATHPETATPA